MLSFVEAWWVRPLQATLRYAQDDNISSIKIVS